MSDREETFDDYIRDVVSKWSHCLDNPLPRLNEVWNHQATKYETKIQELETQAKENLAVYDKALERVKELERMVSGYDKVQAELIAKIQDLQAQEKTSAFILGEATARNVDLGTKLKKLTECKCREYPKDFAYQKQICQGCKNANKLIETME